MSNSETYKKIFIEALNIPEEKFNTEIKYNEIPEWDSIGHMTLMSGLEEQFGISIETDDIVEFGSYKEGINILKKYNINIK